MCVFFCQEPLCGKIFSISINRRGTRGVAADAPDAEDEENVVGARGRRPDKMAVAGSANTGAKSHENPPLVARQSNLPRESDAGTGINYNATTLNAEGSKKITKPMLNGILPQGMATGTARDPGVPFEPL